MSQTGLNFKALSKSLESLYMRVPVDDYTTVRDAIMAINSLREQNQKATAALAAAMEELDRVKAAVQGLQELIDQYVFQCVDYSMYLSLREATDSVITWQYANQWKKKEENNDEVQKH